MAIPTTKEEFRDYCFRALGEPVIRVNVSVEQADDRIDEALDLYWERHFNGTQKTYILYDITDTDVTNGYIKLDPSIMSVISVKRPSSTGAYSPFEYQRYINELYQYSIPYIAGDVSYFFIAQSYLTMINRYFSSESQFTYNRISNKLYIAGGLTNTENLDGGIVIYAAKKLLGEDDSHTTVVEDTDNIWKDKWLLHYATALIKMQWGQNLSKFQNVQLIGGVAMNGDAIKQEAAAEIEALKEQLQLEYELPIDFLIG